MDVKTSDLLTEYTTHTRDNTTENQTVGKRRMQHHYVFLLSEANNYVVERTKYGTTKASQRSYLLPRDYIKMKTVRVKVDTTWYILDEVHSIDEWHQWTMITNTTTIPQRWIVINEQGNLHLEIDGVPISNGTTGNLELVYEGYQDPLTFPADYVGGTASFTEGSATVTGITTVWTSAMVGRFIRPNNGKYWYDIKTVGVDGLALAMVNYFQESDAAAQSYTIAEIPRLPPEFQYTPMWGSVADYYRPTDADKAKQYESVYARELLMLQDKYKSKSTGAVIRGRSVNGVLSSVPRNYPRTPIG